MVRWGKDLRPTDPARRFDGTDVAIARLDRLLAALPPSPEEATMRRRLRLDRLVALRDRVRMQEVADEATSLRADGALPQYAEESYADALLYLRRPEEARDAYQRVLTESPKDVNARFGLFYSAVELEDFATAYATVDGLVGDEPVWRGYREDPTRYDNAERVYAEVTAAQGRFYGNQLADAWERITGIADLAPANGNARMALYQIANARGWPRRAAAEGEIAASLEPGSLEPKIALTELAIADYRFADAQRMSADLLALYPESQSARRLVRDLDADLMWLFDVEAKPADSHGGGANASGRELNLAAKLMTPPIADNWRLYASTDYANSHPPEGFVERSRLNAGIEWRVPYLTASLYPSENWGTLSKPGGGATVDWRATDELDLAFAGELFSWETPLRAVLHDITADSYSAKATYRWHESRSLSATFAYLPFTDGNQRFSSGVTFKQRLVDLPGFDLTGTVEAYASHNDRPAAPYYNPNHDLSVTGEMLAEHTLWRRYDNSLVQALTVNGGLYSEAGFPDNWIGTVSYEHRWRFDPLTAFHYGVMFSRRVYDGLAEYTVTLTLGLTQRF
jgi:biofilm PGA synthesis protein PgaA